MSEESALIFACLLDGRGGGAELDWRGIDAWRPETGTLWIHLDRGTDEARRWLAGKSGLGPTAVEALLAEETRPRTAGMERGLLVILRGVNLNPGEDPEDMVSLRMWVEKDRIISLRRPKLMAVQDLREALQAGTGPRDSADFLAAIADRLVDRMGPVLDDLEDEIDRLEDEVVVAESRRLRTMLATLRRKAILLRRYLAPQREALARLQQDTVEWIDPARRLRLREVGDRVTRYVEDLDAARERAAIVQDELANRLGERMERRMYVLSVIATIFLPLGFLTGLLGINVGGIPGEGDPWAFAIVTAGLVFVGAMQLLILRRLRWI